MKVNEISSHLISGGSSFSRLLPAACHSLAKSKEGSLLNAWVSFGADADGISFSKFSKEEWSHGTALSNDSALGFGGVSRTHRSGPSWRPNKGPFPGQICCASTWVWLPGNTSNVNSENTVDEPRRAWRLFERSSQRTAFFSPAASKHFNCSILTFCRKHLHLVLVRARQGKHSILASWHKTHPS